MALSSKVSQSGALLQGREDVSSDALPDYQPSPATAPQNGEAANTADSQSSPASQSSYDQHHRIPRSTSGERHELLAQWFGEVLELRADHFVARLDDSSGGTEEVGEFDFGDVSAPERELVRPGATFYLTVSHRVLPHGQVRRESEIRFRRLPPFRVEEVELARERATKKIRGLGLRD